MAIIQIRKIMVFFVCFLKSQTGSKDLWKSLEFVPAKNIGELISHYEKKVNLDKIGPNRSLFELKTKAFFRGMFSRKMDYA